MLFHGISIADPANKNIKHDFIKLIFEEENREIQNKSMPHFVISEQDQLNNFQRFEYPSVKGFNTLKESTIPVTTDLETEIKNKHQLARNEKIADVEKSVLEVGKVISDMNGQEYFDPGIKEKTSENLFSPENHVLASTQKFGRPKTDVPTLLSDSNSLAKQNNYLYGSTKKSFQKRFYTNNTWKDSETGRVILFEGLREPTRLA